MGLSRRLTPYAVSAAAVAAVGMVAYAFTRFVPLPHVSILFMAAVLTSAVLWGFGPALFAAVLSVATSMFFFYSPLFDFRVSAMQDIADLAVFVIVAALTSRLAASVAQARLKMQGEALREALINSVSHDLRTPLAAILGSATTLESLGEAGDARTRAELAATIREEAERLESTINNVLDLTRIRAGQIAPRLELVELSDIVNGALRRKQRVLAGHRVRVELPPELPMLNLDLFLMEHALANVLDNAARYAPAGSEIRIRAALEGGEVALDIVDAGCGIAGEDLPRVFDPFYRGAAANGARPAGTGLGLAICRAFVEANGGRVAASSPGAGGGATLSLRLPVPAAEETVVVDE